MVTVQTDQIEDDEEEHEDDYIFKIDTNIDHYRLCKAKRAHDSVLGKIDASLAKIPLTVTEAPRLDTKALIAKLDEIPKSVDFDVCIILAEQIKDPNLGNVRSWFHKKTSPDINHVKFNNQKV